MRDEAANDAGAPLVIELFRRLTAQPAFERSFQQRALIDLLEDFAYRVIRNVAIDACLTDLLQDARAPAMPDRAFHARDRDCDAAIVERPVFFEPGDGGVDVIVIELTSFESSSELGFG